MAIRGMAADSSEASFRAGTVAGSPSRTTGTSKGGLPKTSALDRLETAEAHFGIITFPFTCEETDTQAVSESPGHNHPNLN